MGLKERLARRRSEERIARGTRSSNRKQIDPDAQIDEMLRPIQRRITTIGNTLIRGVNARKGRGKEILKAQLKARVHDAYIAFGRETGSLFGDQSTTTKRRKRK